MAYNKQPCTHHKGCSCFLCHRYYNHLSYFNFTILFERQGVKSPLIEFLLYNKSMDNCCNKCGDPCGRECCGVGRPVIDVQSLPDDILTLSFNLNGVGTTYDYSSMIKAGETDTALSANAIDRVLKYMAERHIDTISAKELGAILHLVDLGDVDGSAVDNNSFLVYKKESDCTKGCDEVTNSWVGWTALDNQDTSLALVMGYTSDGVPKSLSSPANTNQYYQLGWNAAGKVSWKQPRQVTSTSNLAPVYIDKTTKELVFVEN